MKFSSRGIDRALADVSKPHDIGRPRPRPTDLPSWNMNEILGWPPVVWTARILLVTVMGSATWITLVLVIRFFRPKNLRKLLRAELPKLDEVGGEFGGAKANVKFAAQSKALNTLEERMAVLEQHIEKLGRVDTNTLAALKELDPGGGADER